MNQSSAQEYLSGKTLEYVRQNGQSVQMEFQPNGDVKTVNKAANRTSNGVWKVDELGQVCQIYPDAKNCFLIYPSGFILWIEGRSLVTQR
jgi:hypothetical protein